MAAPPDPSDVVRLRAMPGPWVDRLDPGRLPIWDSDWTVGAHSDRVGLRLEGRPLRHAEQLRSAELPSEGLVRGAVQVPPSGLPVLFLADHPVTGGYPVAAVILDADVDAAGQLRPGQRLRLVRTTGKGHRNRPDLASSWWGW